MFSNVWFLIQLNFSPHLDINQLHNIAKIEILNRGRWQPRVVCGAGLRGGRAGRHPHLHGPPDHAGHREPEGEQAGEGERLPPGPARRVRDGRRVLVPGAAVVRGLHRPRHQPRQVTHKGTYALYRVVQQDLHRMFYSYRVIHS